MPIRAIIVDDEPLARERIASLLAESDDIEMVGQYESGAGALREIAEAAPDVVFLDVQMPGIDGFSLLAALKEEQRPVVVFVTAFDEHAVRAFEVNAIDYLLKPFTKERFDRTLERVRSRLDGRDRREYRSQLSHALDQFDRARTERLPIRTEQGTYLLPFEDIDWMEAEGNYMRVHAGAASPRIRETVESLSARLPADRFLRIHRSIIVNVSRILRIEPWAHGEFVVVLRDGAKLKSGRAYSHVVRQLLR